MTKLKPCPFCGGEARTIKRRLNPNDKFSWWQGKIRCLQCGAIVEGFSCYEFENECLNIAIENWNMRVGEK